MREGRVEPSCVFREFSRRQEQVESQVLQECFFEVV